MHAGPGTQGAEILISPAKHDNTPQGIKEHREEYETLALRVAQLLAVIAESINKLGPARSQSSTQADVDHLHQYNMFTRPNRTVR
jgi:hypothetical protein